MKMAVGRSGIKMAAGNSNSPGNSL